KLDIMQLTPLDPFVHPMWRTPWPTVTIISAYLLFVLKLGPKFMENRKPYDLRNVIKCYNIIQIIYNTIGFGLLLFQAIHFLFFLDTYDMSCVVSLPLDHPHKGYERFLCNIYGINKFMDLLETIFFVLRKKKKQITFLHLYHHTLMSSAGYPLGLFVGYGGLFFPFCVINAGVHIIMYAYYYMSSVSVTVQKSLWWKKYITLAQLAQFVTIMVLAIRTFMQPNCNYSRLLMWICLTLNPVWIYLFGSFYVKTYILTGKKQLLKMG
ncbi:hypothetical protein KR018_010464, partial [Drosophila ironensis]